MSQLSSQQIFDLASRHLQAGRLREAEELFRRILSEQPEHVGAIYLSGLIATRLGEKEAAVKLISRALALNSDLPQGHYNLGIALQNSGRLREAIEAYRQEIARTPDHVEAHSNLGAALKELGELDQAIIAYRRALDIQPNRAEVHNNLANALKETGRLDEAIVAYRHAIALKYDFAEAHGNLADALARKGLVSEAIDACRAAVGLQPGSADMHWDLAFYLLLLGRFEEGWKEFEWRLERNGGRLKRSFPQPRWNGEDPRGKTVLLFAEGGFGDAIQFVRYATLVCHRGARVLLECQPTLVRLLQSVKGISQVVAAGDALPAFDWQIPLQSLPMIFNTILDSVPADVPYISPPPELATEWARRLAGDTTFKVGLAWAGSAVNNDKRSRFLAELTPLGEVEGVTFYSLQKGLPADQATPAGMRLQRIADPLADFADSAALVSNLDLVISVDTSVAHLAGALGKRVWVLIPKEAEFRWMLDRTDSPWYPTMRLFRQRTDSDWLGVSQDMATQLRQLVGAAK